MTKLDILQKLTGHKDTLKKMGVKRLCLFGSYARGQETPQSDLDFLVEFEKKTFDSYIELKEFLEKLFNLKVDLVLPEALKPRLRQQILGELIDAA